MVAVEIDVDASDALYRNFRAQMAVQYPLIGAFLIERIDPWMRKRVDERFDLQGDDVTGKWAPLAWMTQQIRFFQGFNPTWPINVRTGEFREWATTTPGNVMASANGAVLRYPANMPSEEMDEKWVQAQRGGKTGRGSPARPVMAIGPEDLEYSLLQLFIWLHESVGHSVGGYVA